MGTRCASASSLGRARLPGHRVIFVRDDDSSGVATIVPAEGDEVWGVLWQLRPSDWDALDRWEGYPTWYTLERHTVLARRPVVALVYVATDSVEQRPSPDYLAGIVRGARAHKIPEEYIARLERFAD